MAEKRRAGRQQAVSEHKRELILDAARESSRTGRTVRLDGR